MGATRAAAWGGAAVALAVALAWAAGGWGALASNPGDLPAPEAQRAPAAEAPGRASLAVATSLEKVRPGRPFPSSTAISLAAAQGECESAQVVVTAQAPLAALAASAGPLAPPDGTQAEAQASPITPALYRVELLDLPRPSGLDGAPGAWPDPLIPVRDGWFGEARCAFPVALPAGARQAIWVEVCVPPAAPAGRWRGAVQVTEQGRPLGQVPLEVTVWPFELPPGPPATFGLATRTGTDALGRKEDPALARALAASLLRHRLSPYGLSYDPPIGRCTAAACALDWSAYDREMGPVLDGTLVPGARGAFADVRVPRQVWEGPEGDLVAWLTAWRRHFEERGWSDRLWLYTLDEPRAAQLPELARRARAARAAGVRVFVTAAPQPSLAGLVDAWAPNLNGFEASAAGYFGAATAGPPWWYVSCLSHACAEPPAGGAPASWERSYRGWPGYEIDRPGAAARVMGWLGFRQGVAGELYYDAIEAWGRGDPWRDPRLFAGNGDGTLLYPGLPAHLGGEHPFPVESVRLKLIRDGLEDWALLRLARERGLGDLAEQVAAGVAPSLRGFARESAPYLEGHRRLGEALARQASAPPPGPTAAPGAGRPAAPAPRPAPAAAGRP